MSRRSFHGSIQPAVEATGGAVGGGKRSELYSDFAHMRLLSRLGCAETRGSGGARRLANSWILSGVHQDSLHVRVNGLKLKCAQGDPGSLSLFLGRRVPRVGLLLLKYIGRGLWF